MMKVITKIKQIICRHTDCKYMYVDKSRRKVFYECKKCGKTTWGTKDAMYLIKLIK
jgi:hypothetical protein